MFSLCPLSSNLRLLPFLMRESGKPMTVVYLENFGFQKIGRKVGSSYRGLVVRDGRLYRQ